MKESRPSQIEEEISANLQSSWKGKLSNNFIADMPSPALSSISRTIYPINRLADHNSNSFDMGRRTGIQNLDIPSQASTPK
jgi:hypothetical protein